MSTGPCGRSLRLLMLANSGDGPIDRKLQAFFVLEVLDDLLDEVGVEDHADDAACESVIDGHHAGVEMLAEELLLRLNGAERGDLLDRDLTRGGSGGGRHHLLLRLRARHRHGRSEWHGCLGHGLAASKRGETRLIDGDRGLLSGREGTGVRVLLLSVVSAASWLLLLVCSSLVWILLRLVVAVLILFLSAAAARLAGAACVRLLHLALTRARGPACLVLVLVLVVPLVVIPVHARLVCRVLLLILIPASASCGARIASLPEATLVIVSAATLVAALTPAVPGMAVLVSLRVLS